MNKVALLVDPQVLQGSTASSDGRPFAATLEAITDDGYLLVRDVKSSQFVCEWLEVVGRGSVALGVGDRLLVQPSGDGGLAVVLGRIGRYGDVPAAQHVTIESTESLTLKCGQSSIDLRADGKVLIRGEDVLVRAKGTKRIRAGTVSIN